MDKTGVSGFLILEEDAVDYDKSKYTLLSNFDMKEGGFRKKNPY